MDEELNFTVTLALEPGPCLLEVGDAGRRRTLHRRGECVVVYVLRGGLVIEGGVEKLHLEAGTAFLGGVTVPTIIDPCRESEYYVVRFGTGGGSTRPDLGIESPTLCAVRRPDRLTYLLRRYLMLSRGDRRYLQMSGLLVLILRELALSEISLECGPHGEKVAETIASRIDAYIAAHFRERIGTPAIAAEMHYNPGYLERAYRRQRNLSIRDAIHLRRLREAGAQLLLHRERCISEIAEMCGYHDANYFSRVFKRTMKMTPNRFRHAYSSPGRDGRRRRVEDVSA